MFTGVIHPEYERVSFAGIRTTSINAHDAEESYISFKAMEGVVVGTADVPKENDGALTVMFVRQAVQYRVDLEGFIYGAAYDFRVRTINPTDGVQFAETIASKSSALVGEGEVARRRELVARAVATQFVGVHGQIARNALMDLRLAILEPALAPYFSYRAAESIRQYFVPDRGAKPRESWDAMHAALGTSRSELFEDPATAVRHGELMDIKNEQGTAYLQSASRILEAFIAYAGKEAEAKRNR